MSNRWPAGIIRKTPVTPAGPLQNGAASGVWSLADAAYWTKQGLWPLAGNTLAVEDVFSTYLYTGNGSTQTITNGIDLAGKGGLVWIKNRVAANDHLVTDTVRGPNTRLWPNLTSAQSSSALYLTAFNANGFDIAYSTVVNGSGSNYASWTFREAPNFFDVVTYTGTGANRNIAHNLGSVPGMILVKRTDSAADWQVYHRSNANTQYQVLNSTAAVATGTTRWNSTTPTATEFTVGTDATVNASGGTYVAYLYAHDATSDGIIQCGSYTGNGSATGPVVTLGWEPQWVIVKRSDTAGVGWYITDTMRGMPVGSADALLTANTADAEVSGQNIDPTATGFQLASTGTAYNASGGTYIYMAIRRGPMRTPTLGTSVFMPSTMTGNGSNQTVSTVGFPPDLVSSLARIFGLTVTGFSDKLRGRELLQPYSTAAKTSYSSSTTNDLISFDQNGVSFGPNSNTNYNNNTTPYINWFFRRAPGFFDEVCYTGTGGAGTITHNLGVVPELVITKGRGGVTNWGVYTAALGPTKALLLNGTNSEITSANYWNNTAPTATQVSLGATTNSSTTFVAYLFASAPGVSKVGSYTGTGALQTINCAFTTGARFVLIKRTDSTGDWFVWDSARGISSGNDPYLELNTYNAEVTGTNYVDTDTTGFKVTAAAPAGINASGGTYIFLAIA